ncbi:hypothetical protein PVAR5_3538 [Paecilomyces variotii No. 5]|uniref:Uncharacterized protein n=1 Tax=Byssochlamys spectabilis (strain No. 5 / NBRC 109023) TaxID=1356009 RepID=V5HY77_BYSSN|nr:hypothetical protein PVAR5_3538 [Paecilomyces variotii No. 5]
MNTLRDALSAIDRARDVLAMTWFEPRRLASERALATPLIADRRGLGQTEPRTGTNSASMARRDREESVWSCYGGARATARVAESSRRLGSELAPNHGQPAPTSRNHVSSAADENPAIPDLDGGG